MNMIDGIANILVYPEFKNSCKFIQMALAEYKDKLCYMPGSPDKCIVTIELSSSNKNIFNKIVWNISSIRIKNKEIITQIPFNQELDATELRNCIQQAIAVPLLYLQIRYSKNTNKNDHFININL